MYNQMNDKWTNIKPEASEPFILLTAYWYVNRWRYSFFTIDKKVDELDESKSYWCVFEEDGQIERGDYADLTSHYYMAIQLLPTKSK